MLQAGVKAGSCCHEYCSSVILTKSEAFRSVLPLNVVVPVAVLLEGFSIRYFACAGHLLIKFIATFPAIQLLAQHGLVYPITISIMQRISIFIATGWLKLCTLCSWKKKQQHFILLAVFGTGLLVGVRHYGALIYIGLKTWDFDHRSLKWSWGLENPLQCFLTWKVKFWSNGLSSQFPLTSGDLGFCPGSQEKLSRIYIMWGEKQAQNKYTGIQNEGDEDIAQLQRE